MKSGTKNSCGIHAGAWKATVDSCVLHQCATTSTTSVFNVIHPLQTLKFEFTWPLKFFITSFIARYLNTQMFKYLASHYKTR